MSSEALKLLLEAVSKLKPEKRKYEKRPGVPPPDRSLNRTSIRLSKIIRTVERGNLAAQESEGFLESMTDSERSFLSSKIAVLRHVSSQRLGESNGRARTGTTSVSPTVNVPEPGDPNIHVVSNTSSDSTLHAVASGTSGEIGSAIFGDRDTDSVSKGAMEVDAKPSRSPRKLYVRPFDPAGPKRRRDDDYIEGSANTRQSDLYEPVARNNPRVPVQAQAAERASTDTAGGDINYLDFL